MSSPEAALRRCWHGVAGTAHDDVVDAIVAAHRQPHRRYHTAVHVMWVLRHVDALVVTEPVADLNAVRAAALFHDIVYEPQRADNETRSSGHVAARALAAAGWPAWRTDTVRAMVEATAHLGWPHGAPSDPLTDVAVLLDADLAILGAEPAAYQAYVTGARAEYAFVDDASWRAGRSAVLHSFLHRESVFVTATMRDQRERRARANITAELATLGG